MFYVLHLKENYCDLWNINLSNGINTFVAKLFKSKKSDFNLICGNISKNGEIIGISYEDETVLFNYSYEKNEIKRLGKIKIQSNFIFFMAICFPCHSPKYNSPIPPFPICFSSSFFSV